MPSTAVIRPALPRPGVGRRAAPLRQGLGRPEQLTVTALCLIHGYPKPQASAPEAWGRHYAPASRYDLAA